MNATVYDFPTPNVSSDSEPLIPAGIYQLQLHTWETRIMFGKASKLIVWFYIADGEYAGIKLPAYYNVSQIKGKAKRKGGFIVRKKSAFAREFFTVLESVGISNFKNYRLDRLPVSELGKHPIKAKIRTVKEANNKPIPKALQYSVISELIGTY